MNRKLPNHIRVKLTHDENSSRIEAMLKSSNLHTICQEAACPNRFECFSNKTATFLIMGKYCTRQCSFCNVEKNSPLPLDENEPVRIAEMIKELELEYVVITSVTRDDLQDGGAEHFSKVIHAVRSLNSEILIEVLIPDFEGNTESLEKVISARPDVINHNLETVPRLYPGVRPQADYKRSLDVLNFVKQNSDIITKSGIMLGLGEKENEVIQLFSDLIDVKCDILTIGQYLSPSELHYPVAEFIEPEKFKYYKAEALKMGFSNVASGPLVRSSYNAKETFRGQN